MKISNQSSVDDTKENKYVSPSQIEKLEKVGIKYIGMTDNGYQCFKIPKGLTNENAFNTYKNILGRCSNRDKGERIEICTMADLKYYISYVNSDDLYVFFNLSDPNSPYQFHYKDDQFMDKNDQALF